MKKILVLDQNNHSVFSTMFFNETLKNHEIEFQFLQQLPKIPNEWECKKIIINPPFVIGSEYWESLKKFIESATQMQIIVMTPDMTEQEIESLIGKHDNVVLLAKKGGRRLEYEKIKEAILAL